MQKMFEELLESTNRDGIEDLMRFLRESDFYTAPASTMHHNAYEGGLVEHSYNVEQELERLVKYTGIDVKEETVKIIGALHDVCKIGVYVIDTEDPTDKQISYLKSLIIKNNDVPPEGDISKKYASQLIGWYVDGMQGEKPKPEDSYVYDDGFPIGHGEKSVIVLQQYIDLTAEEAMAIRYHMGEYGEHDDRNLRKAKEMYPLVELVHLADRIASFREKDMEEVN